MADEMQVNRALMNWRSKEMIQSATQRDKTEENADKSKKI